MGKKKKNKVFKLQMGKLLGFASWMNELQLTGRVSRARTKFVKDLVPGVTELENHRQALLKKYGTEKDGDIVVESPPEFMKEYEPLFKEDYKLDILPSKEEEFQLLRSTILNTTYVFGPREGDSEEEKKAKLRQAADYEIWCDALEEVEL